MEVSEATPATPRHAHKRSRSAALKAMVTPSRIGSPVKNSPTKVEAPVDFLPRDHPHAGPPILGEINQNRRSQSASPRKNLFTKAVADSNNSKDSGKPPMFGLKSPSRRPFSVQPPPKEKENASPMSTTSVVSQPPIWAQFRSQETQDIVKSSDHGGLRPAHEAQFKDFSTPYRRSDDPVRQFNERSERQSGSKVANAVSLLNAKSDTKNPQTPAKNTKDLDVAFEAVLNARNVPEEMRPNMRNLDAAVKAEFIRNAKTETPKTENAEQTKTSLWSTLSRGRSRSTAAERERGEDSSASPTKRSRSRSRTFTLSKGDRSSSKRARSNSRPRSLMLLKNLSSSSVNSVGHDGTTESKEESDLYPKGEEAKDALRRPDDFVRYLRDAQNVQQVEVGKLHKLRILLRNETVSWVDTFILKDGMKELLRLLNQLREIEWREERDDLLLHEVLLCLKGLCTTERALNNLSEEAKVLFPALLNMLFDEERRGPSEFSTRGIVIHLLFTHLATVSNEMTSERANSVLSYLSDPGPPEESKPVGFILQMRQRRPYQRWCKEVSNVTREVFWIFLHHSNVISMPLDEDLPRGDSYKARHFPKSRPPVPAASWVGGVEWEACNYLTSHLDLMNGLIASVSTKEERNLLRTELQASGFEKVMGATLRTCKEKFYRSIHDALRTWIIAAAEDGWLTENVKMGPPKAEENRSPSKSPTKSPKKPEGRPPQLDIPKLDAALGMKKDTGGDGWL